MSDTPRTDQNTLNALKKKLHGTAISYDGLVLADFARELERENARLKADKDRLDWLLDKCVDLSIFDARGAKSVFAMRPIRSEIDHYMGKFPMITLSFNEVGK